MARFEKSFSRLAAALVIIAAAMFMSCDGSAKKAGGGATGANEEYKVFADDAFRDANRLEKVLNDNAKQGWKVRAATTLGNYTIILAVTCPPAMGCPVLAQAAVWPIFPATPK